MEHYCISVLTPELFCIQSYLISNNKQPCIISLDADLGFNLQFYVINQQEVLFSKWTVVKSHQHPFANCSSTVRAQRSKVVFKVLVTCVYISQRACRSNTEREKERVLLQSGSHVVSSRWSPSVISENSVMYVASQICREQPLTHINTRIIEGVRKQAQMITSWSVWRIVRVILGLSRLLLFLCTSPRIYLILPLL